MTPRGIWHRRIDETPVAVLDFETTGGLPGPDRVVEVCVVRAEPGRTPQVVFETLINPGRPMGCTFIHGITDADVADAPPFAAVAGDLVEALAGCVVAAYNVYFDIGFLRDELRRVGLSKVPPHLCLMYLRPLLNLGRRCRLGDACRAHGITFKQAHAAADDTLAAARLWELCRAAAARQQVATFRDLAELRRYKFAESFGHDLFDESLAAALGRSPVKRRAAAAVPGEFAWT